MSGDNLATSQQENINLIFNIKRLLPRQQYLHYTKQCCVFFPCSNAFSAKTGKNVPTKSLYSVLVGINIFLSGCRFFASAFVSIYNLSAAADLPQKTYRAVQQWEYKLYKTKGLSCIRCFSQQKTNTNSAKIMLLLCHQHLHYTK